jgi:putative inorganic carbon (HCO3(-)) transporter
VTAFFVNLGVLAFLKKKWMQAILGILAVLVAVNMFYTYSRGSWLAFLLVSVFLAILIPNKKVKASILMIMAVFLAGILMTPALRDRFLFMLQKGGDSGRFRIWEGALDMFKKSPVIGCGVGLFMDRFTEHTHMGAQYAHNCYLQLLVETGILGLAAFIWSIYEIVHRSFTALKNQIHPISLGIFSGFSAFLIYAFFDTQFYSVKLGIMFWFIAAILVRSLDGDIDRAGVRE